MSTYSAERCCYQTVGQLCIVTIASNRSKNQTTIISIEITKGGDTYRVLFFLKRIFGRSCYGGAGVSPLEMPRIFSFNASLRHAASALVVSLSSSSLSYTVGLGASDAASSPDLVAVAVLGVAFFLSASFFFPVSWDALERGHLRTVC